MYFCWAKKELWWRRGRTRWYSRSAILLQCCDLCSDRLQLLPLPSTFFFNTCLLFMFGVVVPLERHCSCGCAQGIRVKKADGRGNVLVCGSVSSVPGFFVIVRGFLCLEIDVSSKPRDFWLLLCMKEVFFFRGCGSRDRKDVVLPCAALCASGMWKSVQASYRF
jgi:hypothetical protein